MRFFRIVELVVARDLRFCVDLQKLFRIIDGACVTDRQDHIGILRTLRHYITTIFPYVIPLMRLLG